MKKILILVAFLTISLFSYSQRVPKKINKISNKDLKEIGFIEVYHFGKHNTWYFYNGKKKDDIKSIQIDRVDRLFRNRYFILSVMNSKQRSVVNIRLSKYDYFLLLATLYPYIEYAK